MKMVIQTEGRPCSKVQRLERMWCVRKLQMYSIAGASFTRRVGFPLNRIISLTFT